MTRPDPTAVVIELRPVPKSSITGQRPARISHPDLGGWRDVPETRAEQAADELRAGIKLANGLCELYEGHTGHRLTQPQYSRVISNADRIVSFGVGKALGFAGVKPYWHLQGAHGGECLDAEGYGLRPCASETTILFTAARKTP